jgi:hypothetical protein
MFLFKVLKTFLIHEQYQVAPPECSFLEANFALINIIIYQNLLLLTHLYVSL